MLMAQKEKFCSELTKHRVVIAPNIADSFGSDVLCMCMRAACTHVSSPLSVVLTEAGLLT